MSRSKHTEAQMIAALKQVEAGRTTDDVARECGVSKHTIYAWKVKFGGMEPARHRSCALWRMRTDGSSGWWRTSAWTGRC